MKRIKIVNANVFIYNLPICFHDFLITQISDLHLDRQVDKADLKEIIATIAELVPDLVVITGDLVDTECLDFEYFIEDLRQLTSKNGVICVLGNHDYLSNSDALIKFISTIWLRPPLINSAFSIQRGDDRIWFVGIDSCFNNPDISKAISEIPSSDTKIVLWHEPDFAETSSLFKASLQLSGHTHGGQINIPLLRRAFLPKHGKKYIKGKYRINDMFLYVNSGVGSTSYYNKYFGLFRPRKGFVPRPEIACIRLKDSR